MITKVLKTILILKVLLNIQAEVFFKTILISYQQQGISLKQPNKRIKVYLLAALATAFLSEG